MIPCTVLRHRWVSLWPQKLAARLAWVALATLALLALLEVGARLYITRLASEESFLRFASLAQLGSRADSSFTPHRYIGFVPTPGRAKGPDRINSLGFRGEEFELEKPPQEFRIVCLGGSTTYTSAVEDYRLSYPDQLQRALHERGLSHVRVINAGFPGWSSWETLVNFQMRVLDIQPDLAIVYDNVNDVHPRLVWPASSYRGDNSGYLLPVDPMFMPSILEYSSFARILLVASGQIMPHSSLDRTLKGKADSYKGDMFYRQKIKGDYPSRIFEEVSAQEMLDQNTPVYFRRNIGNLIQSARLHGCEVLLATFASSAEFDDPRSSSPEYEHAYNEHNQVMKELSEQLDVPLFDFAAVFPDDRKYYTDGRHVTAEGAALQAELFADFIQSTQLVP